MRVAETITLRLCEVNVQDFAYFIAQGWKGAPGGGLGLQTR